MGIKVKEFLAKPNKTIEEHNEDCKRCALTLYKLGYISKDDYKLLCTIIDYHDLGKVNKPFQQRVITGAKMNRDIELYHNLLSVFLIKREDIPDDDIYYCICYCVLNHHHYDNNLQKMEDIIANYMNLVNELLDGFEIQNLRRRWVNRVLEEYNNPKTIRLAGLLNKCDYAGSAGLPIEYENDFLLDNMDNLLNQWKQNNPKSCWNEMQEFCLENSNSNIIVQASTGMGKTEGALLWGQNNKIFYFLPIKSSINAIYNRIKHNILNDKNIEERISLLHSDTYSIYSDIDGNIDVNDYYNKTKQYSYPLTISTLDQFFNFAYRYAGYELKVATLSYSKIIIDEIQSLDSENLALLIYCLKFLYKNYKTPICITTATLPGFVKDLLLNEIGDFKIGKFFTDVNRHHIETIDDIMEPQSVYEKYLEKKNTHNKILVIANTVKEAQGIFKYFKNQGVENVNMFHGKYIKKDKSVKESRILYDGKTDYDEPVVWIATNIVEASLDIDFDYLITELTDLNSFYQRLGRVNRKGIKNIDSCNCTLYLKINNYLLNKIVDRTLYEKSYQELLGVNGILSEKQKVEIVEKAFSTEAIKKSKYYKELLDKLNQLDTINPYEIDKKDAQFRNINTVNVIPIDIYNKNEQEIEDLLSKFYSSKGIDKIRIKNSILNFTVNYSLDNYKNKTDFFNKMKLFDKKLSDFEYIYIIDADYSFDVGLEKKEEIFI